MMRSSLLLSVVALITAAAVGCSHCDTCDDFPAPCVGPNCGYTAPAGDYSMGPMMMGPVGAPGSGQIVSTPSSGQIPAGGQVPQAVPGGGTAPMPGPGVAPAPNGGPAPAPAGGPELPLIPPVQPAPDTPPAAPTAPSPFDR